MNKIENTNLKSCPTMILPKEQEIIYELYIQAKNSISEDMLKWLDSVQINEMLSYQGFKAAKLYTLINEESKTKSKKYTYYSIQFLVDSIQSLNNYLAIYGEKFRLAANAKYGKNFTEERRILAYQKFYTYESSFNPCEDNDIKKDENTEKNSSDISSLLVKIKNFFGFTRTREPFLIDYINMGVLSQNPILAKNIPSSSSNMISHNIYREPPEPNLQIRDEYVLKPEKDYEKLEKDLNKSNKGNLDMNSNLSNLSQKIDTNKNDPNTNKNSSSDKEQKISNIDNLIQKKKEEEFTFKDNNIVEEKKEYNDKDIRDFSKKEYEKINCGSVPKEEENEIFTNRENDKEINYTEKKIENKEISEC